MTRHMRSALLTLLVAGAAACSIRDAACGRPSNRAVPPTAGEIANAETGNPAPKHFTIVFLGDSLTAGLGLLSEDAYPMVVGRKFAEEGYSNVEVVNAGISGDTTAGGAQRVEGLIDADVKIVVVALGGNDALRGLPVSQSQANLETIIETVHAKGPMVLLAGMEAPTNYGEDYQRDFHTIFLTVARKYRDFTVYMPFLLEGVAGHPDLNQEDGIHPTKQGAIVIAENMYPKLRLMVDQLGGGS